MQFTAEHQPSLVIRSAKSHITTVVDGVALVGRQRDTSTADAAHVNKAFTVSLVCGVVECTECMKPRCVFSVDAPNRMIEANNRH